MRYHLEYALFRFCAFLARALPLESASAVSGLIWRKLAPFSKRHRRAMGHLRIAYPELSESERQIIADGMWDTLGRVFAESFHLDEIAKSDRVVIENEENIRAMFAQANGFIACTAHQGNWEIAAAPLMRLGYKTAGIYQRIKNPYVDAMARKLREPIYTAGLFPKHHSTALAVMKVVRNGGVLSIMADLRDNRGIRVPFFGRDAASTPFPAMMAVSLGKPIFAAHVMREPGVRFRIRVEEVEVSRTGDREADIAATTANLQAALERNIRARPAEWMWGHRRWG